MPRCWRHGAQRIRIEPNRPLRYVYDFLVLLPPFRPLGWFTCSCCRKGFLRIGIFVKESQKQTLTYSHIYFSKTVPIIKPSRGCQGDAMSSTEWQLDLPRAPHLALVKAKQRRGWTMQWCGDLDLGNESRKTVGDARSNNFIPVKAMRSFGARRKTSSFTPF